MNKDKFTLSDLSALLAEKSGFSQKISEDFLKVFFELIENGMMSKDTVKIKDLGSFKLQWNEARKSVNVNTGEEIVISGFWKVVFTPDAELKEAVNEPFAHLEPVVLDASDEPKTTKLPVSESIDPLKVLNDQASEIRNILSEISSIGQEDEIKPVADDKSASELISEMKEEEVIQEDLEEVDEDLVDDLELSDHLAQEKEKTPVVEKPLQTKKSKSPKKVSVGVFISTIIGVMVLTALAIFLYFTEMSTVKHEVQRRIIRKTIVLVHKNKVADSTLTAPVVQATPIPVTDDLSTISRNYTKSLGSEELKSGVRLTRLAVKYYGHRDFWVYIYEANPTILKNPDVLPEGKTINIPEVDKRLIDKENRKCIDFARSLQFKYLKNNK